MEHVRRNVNGHLQTRKAWTCLKSFHQRSAAQEKLLRVKKRTEVATLIYIANLAPEWIQYCWWVEIVYSIQRFTRAYEREVLQVVLLQRDLLQVMTSLAGSATCRIWNFCRPDGRLEPRRSLAEAGAVSGHLGHFGPHPTDFFWTPRAPNESLAVALCLLGQSWLLLPGMNPVPAWPRCQGNA